MSFLYPSSKLTRVSFASRTSPALAAQAACKPLPPNSSISSPMMNSPDPARLAASNRQCAELPWTQHGRSDHLPFINFPSLTNGSKRDFIRRFPHAPYVMWNSGNLNVKRSMSMYNVFCIVDNESIPFPLILVFVRSAITRMNLSMSSIRGHSFLLSPGISIWHEGTSDKSKTWDMSSLTYFFPIPVYRVSPKELRSRIWLSGRRRAFLHPDDSLCLFTGHTISGLVLQYGLHCLLAESWPTPFYLLGKQIFLRLKAVGEIETDWHFVNTENYRSKGRQQHRG